MVSRPLPCFLLTFSVKFVTVLVTLSADLQ